MINRQTILRPLLGSRFVFSPWRRPTEPKNACGQKLSGCPVEALRQSLARESDLLDQKEALIQEQELLRKESEHRLMNGLQIVVSLLSIQSRSALSPDVAAQLSVAASRVATIERVHRRLHSYDGTTTVALRSFLEEVCHDLSRIGGSEDNPEILVQGDEVEMQPVKAIPLGFIVNELITNAIKYGNGRIVVRLKAAPVGGYELSVSNDGPPLPKEFDPARCTGLGMKIIQSLLQRIGGKLSFGPGENCEGARFVVVFS